MEPVMLRTDRLELSAPEPADADAVFAACQDPDVQRYTAVPSPFARSDADELIARARMRWASGEHLTWAIRENGAFAGIIGFYRLDGRGGGELGYWLAARARGRGVLTEAARAVIDWGFAPGGANLQRIEWHAVVGNDASARVARALGFRFEGIRRSALLGKEGRADGWAAALLATDDRTAQIWPTHPD